MTTLAPTLAAISAGAVFMGANTYIGNAPNFMVKAIAEDRGVRMPSFFGYMAWSGGILRAAVRADDVDLVPLKRKDDRWPATRFWSPARCSRRRRRSSARALRGRDQRRRRSLAAARADPHGCRARPAPSSPAASASMPSCSTPTRSCARCATWPSATTTSTSPACTARGVLVTNTPDVLTETTADFGFALMMAAARRITESEHFLRARRVEQVVLRHVRRHRRARRDARHPRHGPHRAGASRGAARSASA